MFYYFVDVCIVNSYLLWKKLPKHSKKLVIFQTRAFEINDRNGSHYSEIRIALFLENLPKKIGVTATGAAGENADNVTKILHINAVFVGI